MPDIFGGPTAGDLAGLWQSESFIIQSHLHAQGWECPKCGRVYSPSMVMCSYCVPPKLATTTATGTAVDPNTMGTFTGVNPNVNPTDPRKPPLTCEDVGCRCGEKAS